MPVRLAAPVVNDAMGSRPVLSLPRILERRPGCGAAPRGLLVDELGHGFGGIQDPLVVGGAGGEDG